MSETAHTEAAPLLPPASVDFNKLHEACVAGASAEDAVSQAVFADTLAAPADETVEVPAADQGDETNGLTKADLKALLDERGVDYETDANRDRLVELVRQNPAPLTVAPPPADEA